MRFSFRKKQVPYDVLEEARSVVNEMPEPRRVMYHWIKATGTTDITSSTVIW